VAEDIAKKLDGVKSVTNDHEVIAPSSRESVEERDEAITARVQKQIFSIACHTVTH
jgi:hypothetical protein